MRSKKKKEACALQWTFFLRSESMCPKFWQNPETKEKKRVIASERESAVGLDLFLYKSICSLLSVCVLVTNDGEGHKDANEVIIVKGEVPAVWH